MKEREQEVFEQELRNLRPIAVPPRLMKRLRSAGPTERLVVVRVEPEAQVPLAAWLRWLFPTAAVAGFSLLLGLQMVVGPGADAQTPPITADDVQIGQTLVGTFDTVARLPDGRPVRFRCEQWMDELVLRDSVLGVAIEQRAPRIEVVPVAFETF